MKIDEQWYNSATGNYVCPICEKQYSKMGIVSHIWRIHGEGKGKKFGGCKKGHVSWNRGLTKETDIRVKHNADAVARKYNETGYTPYWKGRKHTESTIQRMKQNSGGIRKGAGRGKGGYYKGIWCDSTWELAWVVYSLDHDISFKRNLVGFPYEWKCECKLYYPDFILSETNEYIEIKGYMTEKDKAKLTAFPYSIVVITKDLIIPYIEYVVNEYKTDDLVTLYDAGTCTSKRRPEKVCPQCGNPFTPTNNRIITCSDTCRNGRLQEYGRSRSHTKRYPTKDEMIGDVELLGFVGTGKKYGVSDNTIRKWCVGHGIDLRAIKKSSNGRREYNKTCPVCKEKYVTTDKRQMCCNRICGNKLRTLDKKEE